MNFNLNNKKMNVTQTAQNGVVNSETVFNFTQMENFVYANYSGGKIKQGFLVGILKDNELEFRFAQVQINGRLDGGVSKCSLDINENGKLRLIEHFSWESQEGSGINIFEEI